MRKIILIIIQVVIWFLMYSGFVLSVLILGAEIMEKTSGFYETCFETLKLQWAIYSYSDLFGLLTVFIMVFIVTVLSIFSFVDFGKAVNCIARVMLAISLCTPMFFAAKFIVENKVITTVFEIM